MNKLSRLVTCLSILLVSSRNSIVKVLSAFFVVTMLLTISACGTTSGIKQQGEVVEEIDLTKYDVIVIKSFDDGTKKNNLPTYASDNFSDRISSAVRGKGVFKHVLSEEDFNPTDHETSHVIALQGAITRYEEGNAALKFMIGFGAGSTYFDANIELFDILEGTSLGQIHVDKNSWALGGGLAAGQTVDQFMNEAAEKIATELSDAKKVVAAAVKLDAQLQE